MEFLQEVMRGFRRVDEPADTPTDDLPPEDDLGGELDLDTDPDADLMGDEELPLDGDGEPDEMPDDSDLMGDDPTEDPMAGFSDPAGGNAGAGGGELSNDMPSDVAPEDGTDEMSGLDDVANNVNEDPDRQGVMRTVKKAHLVYKRESDAGGFEEMWIYNIGTMKDDLEVRKMILAGTDIPPGKTESPDGSQSYTIWSSGNAEMICIKGLPN